MRIDLRLQSAELNAGRELILALELKAGELRGNEIGETRGKRRLSHIDAAQAWVIQLECAHAMTAHAKRRDNTGTQTGKIAARLIGGITRKHALFARLNHVERGLEHYRGSGRALCRVLAPACQHLPAVSKADGRSDGLGQDNFRGTQGRFGRKAARRVGKYF